MAKRLQKADLLRRKLQKLTIAYKAKLKELQDIAVFEAQEAERLAAME